MTSVSFRAEESEAGERIDVAVARRLEVTRALTQRALRDGSVKVDGVAVRPSHRLSEGEMVEGDLPEPTFGPPEPEDIPIVVRHRDDRVLVVSKPPGIVTHPARGHEGGTLVNALLGMEEELAGRGSIRPGIVHRLDKDTSGLLLVARDDEARDFLIDALRSREVERRYLALVRGRPPGGGGKGGGGKEGGGGRGSVEAPIGRHPVKRRLMAVVGDGRPAITHYETLFATPEMSLLEVTLETGRTHQIRVHLSHLGHPILGDRVYGGVSDLSRRLGLNRPFLHAWRLAFPHPGPSPTRTGPSSSRPGRVEVSDPLPADLVAALEAAGIPMPAAT